MTNTRQESNFDWTRLTDARAGEFLPDIVRTQEHPPSPLPRAVLGALLGLLGVMLLWACFGRLDIVAVAQGKLVPQTFLKIVQPAEPGIVREILVKEGDEVRAGQVLARMDTRLSDADSRVLETELSRRRLQVRRIDAELAGVPMKREATDPAEIYVQAAAQHQDRRQAYLDALATEQAALQKARHDLQSATEIKGKLEKSVPIYKDQAEAWDKLAREGFAGRLLALDRQRTYVESEQDLRAQTQNVSSLQATIAQSERRLAQITSNYRQQLQNERVEAGAVLQKLQQDWDKQQYRHSLLELKAPQAGVVKDLATHSPGTVVAPGTILLTLVPHDEPLVAEAWVSNADAGFVKRQQRVKVKLAAYPFQKYGMLDGVVTHISADAHEKSDASNPAVRPMQEAAYRALISLARDRLESRGERLDLAPGMLVNAEIHLGTRSVLEYLLSPVQKVTHEAGRER
ncbi:MAG TPA: HlyD family type I secretion periplasmic adaptor subunit [Burkholderiales bacterium]|nr:HlyD family type I secretion periplasmic adaptor subunit [Burkholderiales bacterium]